jgi:hypothetical protein
MPSPNFCVRAMLEIYGKIREIFQFPLAMSNIDLFQKLEDLWRSVLGTCQASRSPLRFEKNKIIQISEDTLMLRYGLYYHPTIALRVFWLATYSVTFIPISSSWAQQCACDIFFQRKKPAWTKGLDCSFSKVSTFTCYTIQTSMKLTLGFSLPSGNRTWFSVESSI